MGMIRLDDVLVDFYLSDQLIRPGGFVAFDDTGMPSIATVIDFVLTNRRYEFVRKCGGDIVVLKKQGNDTRTGTILNHSRCTKIGTALKHSRTLLFLQANKRFWVWHEQRERKEFLRRIKSKIAG